MPILAGVIPVASFAQTKRICDLCDASIPAPLEAAFEAAGGDPRARVRAGRRLRRAAVRRAADRRRARASTSTRSTGRRRRGRCSARCGPRGRGSGRAATPATLSRQRRLSCRPPMVDAGRREGATAPGAARTREASRPGPSAQPPDASATRSPRDRGARGRRGRSSSVRQRRRRQRRRRAATPTSTSTPRSARPTGSSRTNGPGPCRRRRKVDRPRRRRPKQAGCDLRLNLQDEGHEHIPAGSPTPGIRDQPADLRQPRRTALPAGRRRLRGNAGGNRHRPLARARPAGDPVLARTCPKRTSWS